jgi:uncharacterized protein (TIGR02722 family)
MDLSGELLIMFETIKLNALTIMTGKFLVLAFAISGHTACTKSFEGEYSDPDKVEIIDDKWNETDAKKTAKHMVAGMLEKPWLAKYTSGNGGKTPFVIVDDVENRTDEHLDVKILTDYLQDELLNSGKVSFVNKEKRQSLLEEIKYQQSGQVDKKSAKQEGRQIGADFILSGNVTSQTHTNGGIKTVTYFTTLTLTNIETFGLEWSTKYEIKKKFKRSGAGW